MYKRQVLFGFLNRAFTEQAGRPLALHVLGAANAPNLVQFLDQNNVDILEAPADAEEAVRRGDLAVVLVIPDEFGKAFTRGAPAQVRLLVDDSNQSGSFAANRAQSLVSQYSNQIGSLRLLARGISPAVSNAVPVEWVSTTAGTGSVDDNIVDVYKRQAVGVGKEHVTRGVRPVVGVAQVCLLYTSRCV